MTTYALSWDPFREFESLFASVADRAYSTAGSTPGVNVYADDEAAVVTTELPGVKPADLDVQLHEDVLRISATRPAETDSSLVRERPALAFARSVALPFPVDPAQVEARLANGVLTVALKRAATDRPHRIQVTQN